MPQQPQPTPKFFAPPAPRSPNPASRYSAPVSRDIPGSGTGQRNPGKVTLSPQEVEAARLSGISVEEYAKNKVEYEHKNPASAGTSDDFQIRWRLYPTRHRCSLASPRPFSVAALPDAPANGPGKAKQGSAKFKTGEIDSHSVAPDRIEARILGRAHPVVPRPAAEAFPLGGPFFRSLPSKAAQVGGNDR